MTSVNQNHQLSLRETGKHQLIRFMLAFIVGIGLLSCADVNESSKSNEGAETTAKVTNSSGGPRLDAMRNAGRAQTMMLPEEVRDAEIQTLDGETFRLADYKGKVVVLDLWATWCPPCREEIPHLIELSKEYKDQGVEVIGLDVDQTETVEAIREFADEFGINYKLGYAEQDFALALMNGNTAIPQTFVISRDGRILNRFIGFSSQKMAGLLRQAVEQAAN